MLVLYRTLNRRQCLISLHCSSIKNTFCKAVILGENLKQETLKSPFCYFFIFLCQSSISKLLTVTAQSNLQKVNEPKQLTCNFDYNLRQLVVGCVFMLLHSVLVCFARLYF